MSEPQECNQQSFMNAARATFERFVGFVDVHYKGNDNDRGPHIIVYISDMRSKNQFPIEYFGIPVCVELITP